MKKYAVLVLMFCYIVVTMGKTYRVQTKEKVQSIKKTDSLTLPTLGFQGWEALFLISRDHAFRGNFQGRQTFFTDSIFLFPCFCVSILLIVKPFQSFKFVF